MIYKSDDFISFSSDAQRLIGNLEQSYAQWLEVKRELEPMPSTMYWAARSGAEYLYVKQNSGSNGTSAGVRSEQTEQQLFAHQEKKRQLEERLSNLESQLRDRVALYRRMRLPSLPDRQAQILRALDINHLLGSDLLVVGTNAFVAYQQFAGAFFPTGNEETEDFDLAWCRGSKASFAKTRDASTKPKTLYAVLQGIDSSYRISKTRPYQAVSSDGYEVELLAAPSTHPLPREEAFDPMASLIEQEWLLKGMPISVVVATQKSRFCPLVVPDPRWMALHKLWLADKPERKQSKREKDRRQGSVLMDAVRHFMQSSHPIDVDFVLDLPRELQDIFDKWCQSRQFSPST